MTHSPTPARLNGHEGLLLEQQADGMLWQGTLSGPMLAELLSAASSGSVELDADAGGVRTAVVQRCWFDVEAGRLLIALRDHGLHA